MRKKWLVLIVGFFVVLLAAYGLGFRWNYSWSVPIGLWRLEDRRIIRRGDYVQVSPNASVWYRLGVEREYYREGAYLLKKVVAIEADLVSYDLAEKSLTVGGAFIPISEIRSRDVMGRAMPSPQFPVRLKHGEAWLSSDNERGYDSRYFGPVSLELLRPARLVLAW